MTEFEKKVQALKELLELHPNGSHFCMTTSQPGFALDAEFLSELISKLEEQKLKIATEAFSEIDNTLMTRNCGHCHCKTSRDDAFDIIKQTLEKIK